MLEKRKLVHGGIMALSATVLMAGGFLVGQGMNAGRIPVQEQPPPLTTDLTRSVRALSARGGAQYQVNGTLARWDGAQWMYSTDGGRIWTADAPEGFRVSAGGGIQIGPDNAFHEEFDQDAFHREIDAYIQELLGSLEQLPMYGYEGGGAYFNTNGTAARQMGGVWEFSSDGGETWTTDAPEGVQVSETGLQMQVGDAAGQGKGASIAPKNIASDWQELLPRDHQNGVSA